MDDSAARSLRVVRDGSLSKGGRPSVSYCYSGGVTLLCYVAIFGIGASLYFLVRSLRCSHVCVRSNGSPIFLYSRVCNSFCYTSRRYVHKGVLANGILLGYRASRLIYLRFRYGAVRSFFSSFQFLLVQFHNERWTILLYFRACSCRLRLPTRVPISIRVSCRPRLFLREPRVPRRGCLPSNFFRKRRCDLSLHERGIPS